MVKPCIKIIIVTLLSVLSFSSCERGELLNSEADIIDVILPDDMKVGKPIITNNEVRIPKIVFSEADSIILEEQLKSLAPQFLLTSGATISDSGVPHNFSQPQKYIVTSEDKKWKKEYEISFFESKFDLTEFAFSYYETYTPAPPYFQRFYEVDRFSGNKLSVWDSGNGGFATVSRLAPAEDYPTSVANMGKIGTGAKLTTRSTGVNSMPIAAGNLFMGYFNSQKSLINPLESTQFGIMTIMDKPEKMSLWCKYKAGNIYKDKAGNTLEIIDRPEIYAVLYEPKTDEDGNPIRLNGTNVRTADNIILIASMTDEQAEEIRVDNIDNSEYKYIEIPFETKIDFDPVKQNNGNYFFTIVFSSSAKGNIFEGAVESTLYVDEINITTK